MENHRQVSYTTENTEGIVMRIEEHFVGLQWVGPQQKCSAVRQLEWRHLHCYGFSWPRFLIQPSSFGVKGSSLLATVRPGYLGSTKPLVRYLRTVLRDKPVRRDILDAVQQLGV